MNSKQKRNKSFTIACCFEKYLGIQKVVSFFVFPMQIAVQILVAVGALNWGTTGIGYFAEMNLNLVNLLLGSWPIAENAVYILVGFAAFIFIASKIQED
jgi:uncharacterized membrane protein YuzA (DUF378 family)